MKQTKENKEFMKQCRYLTTLIIANLLIPGVVIIIHDDGERSKVVWRGFSRRIKKKK